MTYNKTSAVSGDKLIEFLKHTVSNLSEVYLLNLAELAALKEKHANEIKEQSEKYEKQIKELQDKVYNPLSINKYKQEVNNSFQKLFPENKIELVKIK